MSRRAVTGNRNRYILFLRDNNTLVFPRCAEAERGGAEACCTAQHTHNSQLTTHPPLILG
jgi:hypothetical protein